MTRLDEAELLALLDELEPLPREERFDPAKPPDPVAWRAAAAERDAVRERRVLLAAEYGWTRGALGLAEVRRLMPPPPKGGWL